MDEEDNMVFAQLKTKLRICGQNHVHDLSFWQDSLLIALSSVCDVIVLQRGS